MVCFECDFCVFRKLRPLLGSPREGNEKDGKLMACIRRINLDAFWSRATSTVNANRSRIKNMLELANSVGLNGPFEYNMALPGYDHCGYQVAVLMILKSKQAGRYASDHVQWDTIRRTRTTYSNHYKASPEANVEVWALSDERGMAQRMSQDICSSLWFSRFFIGCKRRMGQDWRPNEALTTALVVETLNLVTQRIEANAMPGVRNAWIVFGTYVAVCYTLSLRGSEGCLLDLAGLIRHEPDPANNYFIVALRGKIKGEHNDRCHLIPCINMTSSEIGVKNWITTLVKHKQDLGFHDGPAISDIDGQVLHTKELDIKLASVLEEIYENKRNLFPSNIIQKRDDIANVYQVFRSLRRASNTRAIEQNVSETDIYTVNRWHSIETSRGNKSSRPMHHHYAQAHLQVQPYLRYTIAM